MNNTFTDEEFLSVVNVIIKREAVGEFKPLISMDEVINAHNLDSLGVIVFFVWLSDIFGIEDAHIVTFTDTGEFTIAALKEFVTAHQTQVYSYQEAMEHTYT